MRRFREIDDVFGRAGEERIGQREVISFRTLLFARTVQSDEFLFEIGHGIAENDAVFPDKLMGVVRRKEVRFGEQFSEFVEFVGHGTYLESSTFAVQGLLLQGKSR